MLPAAASIRKQGANKGATAAFLISTPESGVDSIAITYALMDPIMTIIRPVAAFVTATLAGLSENLLFWRESNKTIEVDNSCPVDNCCDGNDCSDEAHRNHHTLLQKISAGIQFGYKDVWGDIVGWFFVGVLLAALITTLLPTDVLIKYLGGGIGSMFVMLVIGIPLYICATASTPIAAALIMKGVSPGAALVFLLVGPATNVTSISVLIGILGKKSTLLYLVILSVSAILFGLFVDSLYLALAISPQAIIGEATELIPEYLKIGSVLLLLAISVRPVMQIMKKKFEKPEMNNHFVSSFPSVPVNKQKERDVK